MLARQFNRRLAQRDFLSRCALFSGLQDAQLDELCAASHLLELPAQAALHQPGDALREVFMLCSGSALRYRLVAADTRKIIELVQAPQLLSLGEVFGGQRYVSACETVAPSIVLALDVRVLRRLVRQDLALSAGVIDALARRQCAIEFDVTGHHSGLTGAQRILDYLIERAGGELPLAGETTVELKAKKKILAARIGITPEAFSRSLRELADKGVIVVDKNRIHIQNAALLETAPSEAPQRLSFSRKLRGARGQDAQHLAAGELINLCGRLRLLTQRLAIAWALARHGIAPAEAGIQLRQRTTEFERTLAQLQRADLDPELARALDALATSWLAYRAALFAHAPESDARRVLAGSEAFLVAADALTTLAEHKAGGEQGHYVNVAGRNRMLSQRIVKFFLFQDLADVADIAADEVAASAAEFDANLAELRRSGGSLPQLLAQLDEVGTQWARLRTALVPSVERMRRSQHVRTVLAEGMRLLRYMDTAVKLYERLTREP
ncbi:MAG: type IV pili methyl-accepting chemotaxis transducer N-terminal domain-containing protein [Thauera sp.]